MCLRGAVYAYRPKQALCHTPDVLHIFFAMLLNNTLRCFMHYTQVMYKVLPQTAIPGALSLT